VLTVAEYSASGRTSDLYARLRVIACLAVLATVLVPPAGALAGSEVPFPRPASLEPNISFWVEVFTAYSSRDFVVHDRDQVWRVYQVFKLPGSDNPTRDDIEWVHSYLLAKWRDTLTRLASGEQPITWEDRKVAAMFKGEPLSAYALAADNLRVQEGLQDRFRQGLLRSRYYYPTMERIFRTCGVPPELVTLAAVESGFYSRARSSAGACGIWQFTRATGRQFMRISRRCDERLNPLRETEAAAKLLRRNYELLGDWPMAITAYNYGTAGMERAAAENGNNYEQVFERYKGPRFGFASRNYYAEFLAALQVHRYENKYFPGIDRESVPPPRNLIRVHSTSHKVRHSGRIRRISAPSGNRTIVSHRA
jgi:membrane-bound lytic murein transglycosylase D